MGRISLLNSGARCAQAAIVRQAAVVSGSSLRAILPEPSLSILHHIGLPMTSRQVSVAKGTGFAYSPIHEFFHSWGNHFAVRRDSTDHAAGRAGAQVAHA